MGGYVQRWEDAAGGYRTQPHLHPVVVPTARPPFFLSFGLKRFFRPIVFAASRYGEGLALMPLLYFLGAAAPTDAYLSLSWALANAMGALSCIVHSICHHAA